MDIQMISLQNNIFILNQLSACLLLYHPKVFNFWRNCCGVQILNMLIIFLNWYLSSCAIYPKYFYVLKQRRFYYELWCRVQVSHASLRSKLEKTLYGVPNLTRIIIFVNLSSSLVGVYVLKMYQILQQRSMLYLNSGVRFRSVMHYCVKISN